MVEGLQNVNRAVAGLPQHVLIVRTIRFTGGPAAGGDVPSWDVSVNYIPVAWPAFTPAKLRVRPNERQLWWLLNASADTILDVELDYNGTAQMLKVVGLDGVPTGSQDGTQRGRSLAMNHILIPPAGRAEFIVTTPSFGVHTAVCARGTSIPAPMAITTPTGP